MAVGASLATKDFGDVLIFGIFGALGYVLKRADWPRVPLIIGMVLGTLAETFLFISADRYGAAFLWERPIVMIVMAFLVFSIAMPIYRKTKRTKRTISPHTEEVE